MEAVDRALVAAIIVLAGVRAARNIRLPLAHPEPRRAALPFGEDPGINLMRAETQVDAVDADDEHRLQCIKQAARYDPSTLCGACSAANFLRRRRPIRRHTTPSAAPRPAPC